MITHFLGLEQVKAYCKDLSERLNDLEDEAPLIWCPVGFSGMEIFRVALNCMPSAFRSRIHFQPLAYQKPSDGNHGCVSVVPAEGSTEAEALSSLQAALKKTPRAIVIDSSVHSGLSILSSVAWLEGQGAENVLTYGLVIKQGTGFVPHYFGLVIGDHDRALFLLDSIPNNRLSKPKRAFKGILRKLKENDVNREGKVDCGVPSITKTGWGDLWYDSEAHGFNVYVVETKGNISGYVKYKIDSRHRLMLDVIAVEKTLHGQGIGAALFRWVETVARSNSCNSIVLWGIETEVENYANAGYHRSGKWMDVGGGEKYQYMTKPLLYHFNLKHLRED